MIKVDNEKMEIRGEEIELLAELSSIVQYFYSAFPEDKVDFAISIARHDNPEQISEEMDKELRLLSLATILATLPEEEQNRIKEKLNDNKV